MGKASIVSGGPDGCYQIQLKYHRGDTAARITVMSADIEVLTDRITAIETEIVEMEAIFQAAVGTSPQGSFEELWSIRSQITRKDCPTGSPQAPSGIPGKARRPLAESSEHSRRHDGRGVVCGS